MITGVILGLGIYGVLALIFFVIMELNTILSGR
jgi:hypothetical protein